MEKYYKELKPLKPSLSRDQMLRKLRAHREVALGRNGIFLGRYEPKDREGNSLGKIFNVFAAQQDLPERMTYNDAVDYIARLREWDGFDGTGYRSDKEIFTALKDGSYNGGWIIPPCELLIGVAAEDESSLRKGNIIQSDNLFDRQNEGSFKGTFKTKGSGGSVYSNLYWSSTEYSKDRSYVQCVTFSDGYRRWYNKRGQKLSCRPVRLVEIKR